MRAQTSVISSSIHAHQSCLKVPLLSLSASGIEFIHFQGNRHAGSSSGSYQKAQAYVTQRCQHL